jgi:parallel beta-helix repeat protein
MQTLRRTVAVLTFPAFAYLGAACERTDTPTEARSPVALQLSNSGATHWVNDDGLPAPPGTSCNNPGYATVQGAVNVALSGDRINVCPGTYTEQVSISGTAKNNIVLRSVRTWQAVIKAPAVMLDPVGAIVRVSGAQEVTILAFTVTGPGVGASLNYGVRVDGGGSADILGNHITQIRDDPLNGSQHGVAVQVGRQFEATTGSARIIGNVIDNYQKNGPTIDNTGSHAEIAHNRILGIGPTAVIAQNGIQVSRGATADIRHNFVSGNIYTPQTFASGGLLLFGPGAVLTDHNTASSNDVSIWMIATASGSMTTHNRVRASTFDGIAVDGPTGNQVARNKTDHNGGPGIGVYDAQNNALDDNKVEDNKDSGILLDFASQNNDIGENKVRDNGTTSTTNPDATDGIRVNDAFSTGNTVHDNRLKHNVTHDCHDNSVGTGTAGTGNFWIDNDGKTSQPTGLCGEDDDDEDFETSTVYGWDAAYPWYDAFDGAAELDFATAYATIDTVSLLQLLPQIRLAGIRRATPSPNQ